MPFASRFLKILFVLTFVLLSFSSESFAQKKKKSTREERKVREATFYFTEGVKYYILSEPDFDSETMDRALMLFKKSLESDPENATAYFKIATILAGRGDLDGGLSNANKALELDPENQYFYTLTADILTRKSNFAEAAQIYEQLIANLEGTDEYLFDLAAIYLYQGDYEQGLEVYNRAEKVFGINPEVTRAKQKIYLKLNTLDTAIA